MRKLLGCVMLAVVLAGCSDNAHDTDPPAGQPSVAESVNEEQERRFAEAKQKRADEAKMQAVPFLNETRKKVEEWTANEDRLGVIVTEYCRLLSESTEYDKSEVGYWKVSGLDALFDEYWRSNTVWSYPIWEAANRANGGCPTLASPPAPRR